MWTDGTQNTETNFAPNSGLEGENCCVKTGERGWRGEKCESLLHGICQQNVDPEIRSIVNPQVVPGSKKLIINWNYQGEGWLPSAVLVNCCFMRGLRTTANDKEVSRECVQLNADINRSQVIVDDLEDFSEYNVTLYSWLTFFNISKETSFLGRTCELNLKLS